MSNDTCVHKWIFKGVFYGIEDYQMSGTSARPRYLVDVFFCENCLEERQKNKRYYGNSYEDHVPGTLPLHAR